MFVRQIVDSADDGQLRVYFVSSCDFFCRGRRLLFKQQFAGAAGCFDNRFDERHPEFPFFEFEDAVDCTTGRGSDRVL